MHLIKKDTLFFGVVNNSIYYKEMFLHGYSNHP